jgi:hypothetical protein
MLKKKKRSKGHPQCQLYTIQLFGMVLNWHLYKDLSIWIGSSLPFVLILHLNAHTLGVVISKAQTQVPQYSNLQNSCHTAGSDRWWPSQTIIPLTKPVLSPGT